MVKEQMTLKYKAAYLEITHDEQKNVVFYKWIGRISDEDARKGMDQILDVIKSTQSVDLVADLTAFTGGSVEIAKWVNEHWSDMLVAAGLKNVAVKLPESAFGGFSNTVALGPKFVSLINVEKFVSNEDVYAWIEQKRINN
ncbi:STAS/SEC14 domain-containing protein [Porifericola rhodea]|uniref:STAS/SEC14 domain-containing protein n=1 Tax=Porifericola rhodea TaxID=930972 RepID=UPI0026655782|nr:STAS/SEC14 domain-containing protein [Porifericola rhodea]WKN30797.1 STAS/SEC14 domain-containing protein [Porifericola rhodea]